MPTTMQDFLLDRTLRALSTLGVSQLVGRWQAGQGAILAFHRVHSPGDREFCSERISISPEVFRRTIATLNQKGYTFLSMSGLVDHLSGRRRIDGRVVCLTFDDGFADTYTSAFAICREYCVPMTVYLVSGYVTREFPMWGFGLEAAVAAGGRLAVPVGNEVLRFDCRSVRGQRTAYKTLLARLAVAHPDDIRRCCDSLARALGIDFAAATDRAVLTPAMIREMRDSGLVEFGAHTASHARLGCLSDADAYREIARSKSECEGLLGLKIRHFAYPYGDATAAGEREAAICAKLGFSSAVTTESRTIRRSDVDRPFALPRLTFNGRLPGQPQLDLLLSGTLPAIRRQWHSWRGWRPFAPRPA